MREAKRNDRGGWNAVTVGKGERQRCWGRKRKIPAVRVVYFLARWEDGRMGRGWEGIGTRCKFGCRGGGNSVHLTLPDQQENGRIVRGRGEIKCSVCMYSYGEIMD